MNQPAPDPSLPGLDFEHGGIRIVALDRRQLGLFLDGQRALLDELGLPAQVIENTDELTGISRSHCLPKMEMAGGDWPFFTRWLAIETVTGLVVADFMLKTGLDSTGALEIGYGTHAGNEGRGVMTRTVACFVEWARLHPSVKRVKAEVEKHNTASTRVLEKNGFRKFAPLGESDWWEKRV